MRTQTIMESVNVVDDFKNCVEFSEEEIFNFTNEAVDESRTD